MANINTYLQKILAAIYGEEVRGSIHDAIAAINEESVKAKEDASTAKDSAQASATAASKSAAAAEKSASDALASKNSAATALTEANKAKDAANSANDAAQRSATAASQSETAAASSATAAGTAKNRSEEILSEVQKVNDTVDGKVESVMSLKWNLVANHCINDDLLDSSGNPILDSSGASVIATVIYADANDIIQLQKQINNLELMFENIYGLLLESRVNHLEAFTRELETHSLLDNEY